jgi:glucan phosphoethanolaminetransferase (alkaline phosphatase superfamily)
MMSRVTKGIVAGLAATITVAVLEAVNVFALNWFTPFPDVIANVLGLDGNQAAGWAIHLVSGTVILGGLFGILCPRLPTDTPETKGILFAVCAWVAMMLVIMLTGDSGVFGRNFATVAWMLITHAVYGIVLGNVYARLVAREKRTAAMVNGVPA